MAGLANRHTVCDLTFSHKDDDGRLQWSVDIMREGVDQPVDSFLISKTNMPPRYNKNRKVAWQLPLVETVAVRLGAADVMRVLDLYQERRKDRQRQAAKENKYQESVLSSRLSSGALATTSAEEELPITELLHETSLSDEKARKANEKKKMLAVKREARQRNAATVAAATQQLPVLPQQALPTHPQKLPTPPGLAPPGFDPPGLAGFPPPDLCNFPSSPSPISLSAPTSSGASGVAASLVLAYYATLTPLNPDLSLVPLLTQLYAPNASKSITVGLQNIVVSGATGIAEQLSSFCPFMKVAVTCTVAHETGGGLLVHTCGTCRNMAPSNNVATQETKFSQAFVLVKVDGTVNEWKITSDSMICNI